MAPVLPVSNDQPGSDSGDEVRNGASVAYPVTVVTDSDSGDGSDEEAPAYAGYELLPQDPEPFPQTVTNVSEELNFPTAAVHEGLVTHPNVLSFHLCAGPASVQDELPPEVNSRQEIQMDEEHIETIKTVMRSVTLPASNLPSWSAAVPEEEWKAVLFERLRSGAPTLDQSSNSTTDHRNFPESSRSDEASRNDSTIHRAFNSGENRGT